MIEVFALVNDERVLENNLRRSPAIASGQIPLHCLRGQKSATAAFDKILTDNPKGVFCFVHQDVYLPANWLDNIKKAIRKLEKRDPNWAVLGSYGVQADGIHVGQVWDSSWNKVFGNSSADLFPVVSLDEIFLCVRADAGNLFDPNLPDFHLYGTDVVQNALAQGLKSYVANMPVVHNSRRAVSLRGGYERAYRYMRIKWRKKLSIPTTIVPLSQSLFPLYKKHLQNIRHYGLSSRRPPHSILNPAIIAAQLGWDKN